MGVLDEPPVMSLLVDSFQNGEYPMRNCIQDQWEASQKANKEYDCQDPLTPGAGEFMTSPSQAEKVSAFKGSHIECSFPQLT